MVGLQEQPITNGDLQLTSYTYIERRSGAAGDEINFNSIGTADTQAVFDHGHDFHGVAPVKVFGLANKAQALARFVLPGVLLLRRCPRERIKHAKRVLILAERTVGFQRLAHFLGHGLNLRPGRRDQQRGPALLCGRQVGIGGVLIELAVIGQRLCHSAEFEQFGKGFVGLFGGSQLDNLPEDFGLLAANGG